MTQICVLYLSVTLSTPFYDICPNHVLWDSVASNVCPNRSSFYHCLMISDGSAFEEQCTDYLLTQEGYFPVLDEVFKNLNYKKCPADSYQPHFTFTNKVNRCIDQKSLCNEEGQVQVSEGTALTDRTCRCDYTKGYVYVSMPVDICNCAPVTEDCSCNLKRCRNGEVLNQDYDCGSKPNETSARSYKCPELLNVDSNYTTDGIEEEDLPSNVTKLETHSSSVAFAIIIVFLFIILVLLLLCYMFMRRFNTKGKLVITAHQRIYSIPVGTSVTMRVVVTAKSRKLSTIYGEPYLGRVYWVKGEEGKEISVDVSYNPELTFEIVEPSDQGFYRCCVTNDDGMTFSSERIKLQIIGSPEVYSNMPDFIRKKGKNAFERYKSIIKTEICQQRTIYLVIVGTRQSHKSELINGILGRITPTTEKSQQKFVVDISAKTWKEYKSSDFDSITRSHFSDNQESLKKNTINVVVLNIPEGPHSLEIYEQFLPSNGLYIVVVDTKDDLYVEERQYGHAVHYSNTEEGEQLGNLLSAVHSLKQPSQDSKDKLLPLILIVATKSLYEQVKIPQIQNKVLNCAHSYKKLMEKHILQTILYNMDDSSEVAVNSVRERIFDVFGKVISEEVPLRYLYLEDKLCDFGQTVPVLAFEDVHSLAKQSGYPVTDHQEIKNFLSYQHRTGNVIYAEDLPNHIIINPNWFYDKLHDVRKAFKLGKSLNETFTNGCLPVDEVLPNYSNKNFHINVAKVFQSFGYIVKVDLPDYEEDTIYYVPWMTIKQSPTDIPDLYAEGRSDKTSFLCLSCNPFLPSSLVYFVIIKLLEAYPPCEGKKNAEIALFHRAVVLNLDREGKQRLYIFNIRNELCLQVWFYGVTLIKENFIILREEIEKIIQIYKGRKKMNLQYQYKISCPDSRDPLKGAVNVVRGMDQHANVSCKEHNDHQDLYSDWFQFVAKSDVEKIDPKKDSFTEDVPTNVPATKDVKRNLGAIFDKRERNKSSVLGHPIIFIDQGPYSVTEGEDFRLKCRITSRVYPVEVQWWKEYKGDGAPLFLPTRMSEDSDTSSTLELTAVQTEDQGYYWCVGTNDIGTSKSNKVYVEVNPKETSQTSTEPGTDIVILGQTERYQRSTSNSSYGSFKSTTENEEEREQNDQIAHQQKKEKEEVFDAVIIYCKEDREKAEMFRDHLIELLEYVDVRLIEEVAKPGQTNIASTNNLFDRARYVLILVTRSFTMDKLNRFIAEKVLMESLYDETKMFRVIPVSYSGLGFMPDELIPLIAIQYRHFIDAQSQGKKDIIYVRTLERLFKHGRETYLINK